MENIEEKNKHTKLFAIMDLREQGPFKKLSKIYSITNKDALSEFLLKQKDLISFLAFYNKYKQNIKKNNKDIDATFDEDGRIEIDKLNYLEINKEIAEAYYAFKWIILDTGELALLKCIPSSDDDSLIELEKDIIQKDELNNLVAHSLGKQMNIKTAKYYLCKSKVSNYILSIDFLEGKELIHGYDITHNDDTEIVENNDIKKLYSDLENYLKLRKFDENKIEKVKVNFLKNIFFDKFILQDDENNGNWGIVVDKKDVEMAPCYDFDYTFGIKGGRGKKKINEGKELKDFLEYFSENTELIKFIESSINNIDFNLLFTDIYDEAHIKISNQRQNDYKAHIEYSLNIVKKFLKERESGINYDNEFEMD